VRLPAAACWPSSPYYLLLGNEPLARSLRVIGAVSVLGAVAAILVVGGLVFARRDLNRQGQVRLWRFAASIPATEGLLVARHSNFNRGGLWPVPR
jgi:hypothetical protein